MNKMAKMAAAALLTIVATAGVIVPAEVSSAGPVSAASQGSCC